MQNCLTGNGILSTAAVGRKTFGHCAGWFNIRCNAFAIKLDSSGDAIWAHNYGGNLLPPLR
jgi:hypothetical protein